MFSYSVFKGFVYEKIKDYMPVEYSEIEMEFVTTQKVNKSREGIKFAGQAGKTVPVMYLDSMYQDYLESGDIRSVLSSAANSYIDTLSRADQISAAVRINMGKETIEKNIVFQVINTDQNAELLRNVPHRELEDLSIVYRWIVVPKTENTEMHDVLINNDISRKFNFTEKTLFELAYKNTKRIMPVFVKNIDDIIPVPDSEVDDNLSMWVISNEAGINGAASMIYDDVLYNLADNLESDLYILPSSINEVIAVKASSYMTELHDLEALVKDVNDACVDPEERLSDHVYYYNKDSRELTLAVTDNAEKSLNESDDLSKSGRRNRSI